MESLDFSPVKIYLLGRFEITEREKTLRAADWKRQKAAALLKRLAYERKLLKDQAVDFLWPDADLASGANNLYRTLHALRATLNETFGEGAANLIFTFTDGILTLSETVWVDAHDFEEQARLHNYQYLITNYAGDFLPDDLYEDWTQTPRENLFRLYRDAVLAQAGSDPRLRLGCWPRCLPATPSTNQPIGQSCAPTRCPGDATMPCASTKPAWMFWKPN